jgi:hypothetical protein
MKWKIENRNSIEQEENIQPTDEWLTQDEEDT